jgi:imidazole glycerol phosphate synthase glutamine amidotransferase subunit
MIALLDYGAGNVGSVLKAVRYLGCKGVVVANADELAGASKIILPGQGHFGSMMRGLDERKLIEPLRRSLTEGVPFLGICLGLQALYERSEEAPEALGLGILSGQVEKFEGVFKVPHLGWNQLEIRRSGGILRGVPDGSFVYYCHSYIGPVTPESSAVTQYGQTFCAVAERDRVAAVQFHPEKSGDVGLQVLKNFLDS